MKNYWKKLKSKIIFNHPRIVVIEDDVLLPSGKEIKYVLFEGMGDYVTVIAEQDRKVMLIKEYSYPHDEWLWQFPEGTIEAGEDLLVASDRELQEEAGLRAEILVQIGMNYDHHRRTVRKNYIIMATELHEVHGVAGDAEEMGIETKWFTIEMVHKMIGKGEIRQKNILAAWPIFLAHQSGK